MPKSHKLHHPSLNGSTMGLASVANGLQQLSLGCHDSHNIIHRRGWQLCMTTATATATTVVVAVVVHTPLYFFNFHLIFFFIIPILFFVFKFSLNSCRGPTAMIVGPV